MEILIVIACVYCIYLIDKWADKRSADKFVNKYRKHV